MQLQGRQLVPRPAATLQLRPLLVGVRGILLGPLLGASVCLTDRFPSVYGMAKLLFHQGLHGEPPRQADTTLSMDSLAVLIAAKVSIDRASSQDRFDGGLHSFARGSLRVVTSSPSLILVLSNTRKMRCYAELNVRLY